MWGTRKPKLPKLLPEPPKPPKPPKPPRERPVLRGHGITVYQDGTVKRLGKVLGNVRDMQAYVVHGHAEAGPGRVAMAIAGLGSARVYRYKLQIKSRVPVERSDRNGVRWTEQSVLWEVQLSAEAVDLIGGIGGRVTASERVAAHVTQTERWANTFNGLAKELGGS